MFAFESPSRRKLPSMVEETWKAESERQRRELILIPSESICFPECAAAVASDLGNIYAEGQPDPRLSRAPAAMARDGAVFESWHRRLSDARFYRGCREADRAELLAKGYLAEAFAKLPGSPAAEKIHSNVQALSGAAANLSVYTALLEPGDGLLGLDLSHGGHLSHGSPFNVSGRLYRAESYGIDEQAKGAARKLDYNRIRELAKKHRPKILIGGSSAYPWDFDWKTLRGIADEVGALLMADIAHLAGMVFGGVLSNPLPHAHIVTFTTHKTLCGPRGACIVTTCGETARKIDNAVFPGLQGGPHVNAIAGIARLFEIVCQRGAEFGQFQKKIVENAKVFADALTEQGFTLEYGGTNTHLLLVDLKSFKTQGAGARLDGETASRLLENAGIICNKNTLPGDANASKSSGVRFGTPWLTQRGVTPDQLRELARTLHALLKTAHSFAVWVPAGEERCRARVPFDALADARHKVAAIAGALPYPKIAEEADMVSSTFVLPMTVHGRRGLLVRGEKARLALEQVLTCGMLSLSEGQVAHGLLLKPDGSPLDDVLVQFLGHKTGGSFGPNGEDAFALLVHVDCFETVNAWLAALSDGYVIFDPQDFYAKIDGPFTVELLENAKLTPALRDAAKSKEALLLSVDQAPPGAVDAAKVFFIGQKTLPPKLAAPAKKPYAYDVPEGPLKKTILNAWHKQAGAKMVPFGGWEMPVEYPSGIFAEHAAVRSAAGLFDVSHMSALEVSGKLAVPFLETVFTNTAARLVPNEAQYSYMLLPDATALDDLYVYRIDAERFMVVVNAGNAERDIHWLHAVNSGAFVIDPALPGKRAPGPVKLTDLRTAGKDALLDFAFQGPLSSVILAELAGEPSQRARILGSKLNDFFEVKLQGLPVRAARTGYTGEETAFELFVHPDHGVKLWDLLLKQGKDRGVLPCGLGARDSLRIEAGFPLFGHEIEGSEHLSLTEADYGFVCRHHAPFYIGRDAYLKRNAPRKKRLLRLKGAGRRSVRSGACVLGSDGQPAGVVTSFAFSDPEFNYHVLAAVHAKFNPKPGSVVKVARATPEQVASGEPLDESKIVDLTVAARFPEPAEKAGWRSQYKPKT
ncbi:MAG: serine hydroxymethyltransferase [Planctomycetes bacterium]|nr:serine hydroxymethyltransferase [Planctomycetota bacterium]